MSAMTKQQAIEMAKEAIERATRECNRWFLVRSGYINILADLEDGRLAPEGYDDAVARELQKINGHG